MNERPQRGPRRRQAAVLSSLAVAMIALAYGTVRPYQPGPTPGDTRLATVPEVVEALAVGDALVIIDARDRSRVGVSSRLPGAVHLPPSSFKEPGTQGLRSPREVARELTEKGITPSVPVAIVSNSVGEAAYVAWVLLNLGHSDVRLIEPLDESQLETQLGPFESPGESQGESPGPSSDQAGVNQGRSKQGESDWSLSQGGRWPTGHYADALALYQDLNNPGVVLIDSRSGPEREVVIARHVATRDRHLPWRWILAEDERSLRDPMSLQRLTSGLPAQSRLVVYGNDPEKSALVWWVLYRQGFRAALFDEPFQTWTEAGFPVRTVDGTVSAPPPSGGCI